MCELLRELGRNIWRPPDRRPPWAWAQEHIHSIPYSPVPGRFRADNSPWLKEPLEALVDLPQRLGNFALDQTPKKRRVRDNRHRNQRRARGYRHGVLRARRCGHRRAGLLAGGNAQQTRRNGNAHHTDH